jgi:diguanylate cyclase (GGDEF)-like protein
MDTDDSGDAALRKEIRRLQDALARAEREAMLDALTGCLNRRGWTEALRAEERRCCRHGLDALVVIVDLDGLKAVNDTEGHDAGDRCLIGCGAALRRAVRTEDAVARLGGDEFAVLAVQTAPRAPEAVVAHLELALADADVKASVGWALRSRHAGLAEAVTEADRRMLSSKGERAAAR